MEFTNVYTQSNTCQANVMYRTINSTGYENLITAQSLNLETYTYVI